MKIYSSKTPKLIKSIIGGALGLISITQINAQTVNSWLTTNSQSSLLSQQAAVSFTAASGTPTISINQGTTYQSIDGYGFCLTEGSAEAINQLTTAQQNALLNDFFNTSSGIGVSVVRISIGASDLSSSSYSYNDGAADPNLNNFSLAGPDLTYLIPLLKRILAINPNIKVLATPWSAPKWMKTNNAWVGGSLNTNYYNAYANYFVKYLAAMKAQGINIWAVTPQNEPENPYNEPSMLMNATEATNFINILGPAIKNAGYATKIIAFDHNCDNTAYPTQVLNNSSYADGAAFHLYAGNISAMSTVHNNTGKNVYFTEQFTSTTGGFSGDFPWHMQNVMIGSMNNWGKTALEWNLATNSSFGPRTPGGCTTCLGAVTINNSTSYSKNVSFYVVGQLSKFVKPDAVRIQTTSTNGNLTNVAFRNPDGSIVLVVYNSGGTTTMSVGFNSKAFSVSVPGSSAVTYVFNPLPTGTTSLSGKYYIQNRNSGQFLDLINSDAADGAKFDQWTFNGGNNQQVALTHLGNGMYKMLSVSSGKSLDIENVSVADGAKVQQWTYYAGAANQEFVVAPTGDGFYKILPVHSAKIIEVAGASTTAGAAVQQWADNGQTCGQWKFIPTTDVPVISVTSPANNATYTAPAAINITATATDTYANISKVEFYNGTAKIGEDVTSPYAYNWTNVAAGTYTITAKAINEINGTATSSAITVKVNAPNVVPTVSLTAPTAGTTFTSPATVAISANAADSDGSIAKVEFYNGNTLLNSDATAPYSYSWTNVAVGTYAITAKAYDNSGTITTSAAVSITVKAPNVAPTVSLTAPTAGATFTSPATVAISANAADSDGSIAKVEFYNGNTLLNSDSTAPYSYSWTNVAAGTYAITAKAYDNEGATTTSAAVSITVKAPNVPPTVTLSAPTADATFSAPASITISANAADSDGSISKVEFYNGTAKIGEALSKPYNFIWENVSIGNYALTAKAYDNEGAVNTSNQVLVIVTQTTNVNDKTIIDQLLAYPNPTTGLVSFSDEVKSVIVSDLSGKVLDKIVITDSKQLNLEAYTSGIYLLKLEAETNNSYIKIIKE